MSICLSSYLSQSHPLYLCVLPVCASRLVRSANTSLVQYANELALGQRVRAQTGGRIIAQWCIVLCIRETEKECVRVSKCLPRIM